MSIRTTGRRATVALTALTATITATVTAGLAASPAGAQPGTDSVPAVRSVRPVPLPMAGAVDMNDRGEIVGWSNDGSGVLWRDGVTVRLRGLGGTGSMPWDINNRGQVVGQADTASGESHAFLWDRGVMTDLGTLGGSESIALAVNDHGEVVGTSTTADGSRAYFVWRRGVMTRIPVPGEVRFAINSVYINNRGRVVGTYEVPAEPPLSGLSRVWLWERGRLTDLGALGGHNVQPAGLNDRGQFVYRDISGIFEAATVCVWDDGVRTGIGPAAVPLGSAAINQSGQVAFTGPPPGGSGPDHGYLWTRGRLTDLGSLGGGESAVGALNDRGEVIGTSVTADVGYRGFVWRAGTMIRLESLAPDQTSGAGRINNAGMVLGSSTPIYPPGHAVVWYTR
jgi:probable HAF family extracellular repeat protein